MDKLELDTTNVVDMDQVAEGVRGLRVIFVNVFGIEHSDGNWSLVDAGLSIAKGRIHDWAMHQFGKAPVALILTHGHFDHIGAARDLADAWDIPIYAHPLEFPYLTGQQSYPPPNAAAGGGAMSLFSPLYPRGPVDLTDRLRPLESVSGWEVIFTPGHTPGHVSLYRAEDRLLLAGDAFCTTKSEAFFEAAVDQDPELHGPPAYFTWDWPEAGASVRKLAALLPTRVAPGHGKPVHGEDVAGRLTQLAAKFYEIAVPDNRR
jgi:glyoxylase-like metal-dependent hydrolase (beta-lactamase superfamily II)